MRRLARRRRVRRRPAVRAAAGRDAARSGRGRSPSSCATMVNRYGPVSGGIPTASPSTSPGPGQVRSEHGADGRRPDDEREVAAARGVGREVGGGEPRLQVGRLRRADRGRSRRAGAGSEPTATASDDEHDTDQRDGHARSSSAAGDPGGARTRRAAPRGPPCRASRRRWRAPRTLRRPRSRPQAPHRARRSRRTRGRRAPGRSRAPRRFAAGRLAIACGVRAAASVDLGHLAPSLTRRGRRCAGCRGR